MAVVHFAGIFVRGVRPRLVRGDACTTTSMPAPSCSTATSTSRTTTRDFIVWTSNRPALPRILLGLSAHPDGPGSQLHGRRDAAGVGAVLPRYDRRVEGRGDGREFVSCRRIRPRVPDAPRCPTGLAAIALALWFTFVLCRNVYGPRAAMIGVLGMLVGSSLLYYSLISPSVLPRGVGDGDVRVLPVPGGARDPATHSGDMSCSACWWARRRCSLAGRRAAGRCRAGRSLSRQAGRLAASPRCVVRWRARARGRGSGPGGLCPANGRLASPGTGSP